MGCALAIALSRKGFGIGGVYNRTAETVEFLAEILGRRPQDCIRPVMANSDVVFVTVADDYIEKMAEDIASSTGDAAIRGKVFFHCSGALDSGALNALAGLGGHTGSLHPIQTFADRQNGWEGLLSNIYFGFEGCQQAFETARKIVSAFGGAMIEIKKEDKPLYHAAACMLSNYMVTLSDTAAGILESIGIDREDGMKAFMPLLEKTVKNIGAAGPAKALTGPISRGDWQVVGSHVKSIDRKCPEAGEVYRTLGRKTVRLAAAEGKIGKESVDKLYEALGGL